MIPNQHYRKHPKAFRTQEEGRGEPVAAESIAVNTSHERTRVANKYQTRVRHIHPSESVIT